MSCAQARNPSRANLSLGVPALLLALLVATPLARAQDEHVPHRVGPVPHADEPRPLIDATAGAALAAQGKGDEPGGAQALGIDPGTGAFSITELEVFQPGIAGLDLRFERMHLSNAAYNGPLGWNWDSPLFMRIADGGVHTTATLYDGRFSVGAFTWASSSGGVDNYATPNAWFLQMQRTGSGTGSLFTLTDSMGLQFRLEYDVQQFGLTWYRLKDITDTNGNRLQFTYGANGLLQTIRDTVGNTSSLTWIASGANAGRLQTFTAPGGATVTFVYDAAGNLVSAQRPAPDNAAGTANETATYDASHRLVSLTNPAEISPWLVNGYDGAGRVVSQQLGGPGQVITTSWASWPLISITDRLGQITDYAVNPSTGDVTAHSVRDMSQPGFAWTTTFTWDAHHHLLSEVRPDGETFEWSWETSADPKRRDNLVRHEHKTSPSAPSGLKATWGYTSSFNKLAWSMTPRANAQSGGVFSKPLATNYTYDSRGNMLGVTFPIVTTPSGTQTIALGWTYDARGRVATYTGPRGLLMQMKYTDTPVLRPFPTRVISDPFGAAVAEGYAYDSINRMTQSTRPCSCGGSLAKASFTYDAGRRLREVVVDLDAATQRHTLYDHDLNGRTIASRVQDDSPVGDGWAVNAFTYDALGHLLAASEDVDASTTAVDGYAYDNDGRLMLSVSAGGVGTSWSYDERDLVTERRYVGDLADATDDVVELLQRDLGGRVSRFDRADGTFETYTWDGYGRLGSVTDVLGRVTSYTYDEDGRILSEELRTAAGVLLDRWTFAWDAVGRLYQVERLAQDDAGAPLGGGDGMLTQLVERDASGNVIAVHAEDGTIVTKTYDAFDRMLSARDGQSPASGIDFDYHAAGQPYRLWAVEGDPNTGLSPRRLLAEWTSYDLAGRPLQVRDAAGAANTYTWSLRGEVVRLVDRNGQRVDMTRDERGQLLTHQRLMKPAAGPGPQDLLYDYGYDLDGRVTRATAHQSGFGPDQSTFLLHDAFGGLDTVVWPDGSTDSYDYDAARRVAAYHDPRGNVVSCSYDVASRLSDVAIARAPGVGGATAEHYDYDARDNVTLARNDDYDILRSFDSLGDVQAETTIDRITGLTRSTRADYDPSGRLARLQYPSHTAAVPDFLMLGWDGADRLTSLVKQEGASQRTVAQFQWMGDRLLKRWNGTLESLVSWDGLGRMSSTLHRRTGSGTPIAKFDMRYDGTSHVTGVLRSFYDAAGNALPDGASGGYGGGQDNQYDAAYRLVASRGGISATDWLAGQVGSALLQSLLQYDRNENRTLASTNSGGPLWQLTQYVAGAINQYLSVGGVGATYDSGGNLLSMPGGPSILAYDYANRPVSWSEGGLTDTARYDALGRRIATGNAVRAEVYTYFDAYALEQLVAGYGAPVREFVYGSELDEVLELRDAGGNAAYPVASNEMGSPVALMTSTGAVVESYRYSTFGRRFAASTTTGAILPGPSSVVGMPVAFSGRPTMNGSDSLLDFRARTYLPDWGRFAEQDPLGYPNGRLNRYQLSGNDPYRKDNFGLHDDGNPTDPPNVNTHVGITKEAGNQAGFDPADRDLAAFWNWYQDNSGNVAGLNSPNNFNYHALGRTEAEQQARLRELMNAATGATTGQCSMQSMGEALHYAQDMVAHRTMKGAIYPEGTGHALDTVTDFDPDGPEDPTGNELVTRHRLGWSGWHPTIVAYKTARNPYGFERHLRKLRAIANSVALMKEFMQKCGPGTGQAFWPRYSGGKPKPVNTGGKTGGKTKGPSTGGKTEGPTTGGCTGPLTHPTTTTGGNADKPKTKGPTTPGGGATTRPSTGGPTTPGSNGPTTPGPSTGGPSTGGPSGPTTPGPTTPGTPQGPTTPGPGTPTGPITPGAETGGPWTPAGSVPGGEHPGGG